MNTNGFILWEGNSLFDNQPIVVVVTGYKIPSANEKTGDMLQSWILRKEDYPSENIKSGEDKTICGNCPLRGKSCYVTMMAPNNIWRNYREGQYCQINETILKKIKRKNKLIRLGAYGDPCSVPLESWLPILEKTYDHTGYTHAWKYTDQRWNKYIRASVESHAGKELANSMGWKTFRITTDPNDVLEDEVLCRNYIDKDITCEECRLCNGGANKPNVVIVVHGSKWKVDRFKEMVAA